MGNLWFFKQINLPSKISSELALVDFKENFLLQIGQIRYWIMVCFKVITIMIKGNKNH